MFFFLLFFLNCITNCHRYVFHVYVHQLWPLVNNCSQFYFVPFGWWCQHNSVELFPALKWKFVGILIPSYGNVLRIRPLVEYPQTQWLRINIPQFSIWVLKLQLFLSSLMYLIFIERSIVTIEKTHSFTAFFTIWQLTPSRRTRNKSS